MKPTTTFVAPAPAARPNRILVALAAAWMILSLAIGGAVTAESRAGAQAPTQTVTSATGQ